MFISTEIRLDIGSDAARHKLADLARDGLLGRASGEAYDQWQAGLVRVGSQGTMLGMYPLRHAVVGTGDEQDPHRRSPLMVPPAQSVPAGP